MWSDPCCGVGPTCNTRPTGSTPPPVDLGSGAGVCQGVLSLPKNYALCCVNKFDHCSNLRIAALFQTFQVPSLGSKRKHFCVHTGRTARKFSLLQYNRQKQESADNVPLMSCYSEASMLTGGVACNTARAAEDPDTRTARVCDAAPRAAQWRTQLRE